MTSIVEVDEAGTLHLPASILPESAPRTRYLASMQGQQLVLARAGAEAGLWNTTTPEEWVRDFRAWVAGHKDGPGLSDEAISRDTIYD